MNTDLQSASKSLQDIQKSQQISEDDKTNGKELIAIADSSKDLIQNELVDNKQSPNEEAKQQQVTVPMKFRTKVLIFVIVLIMMAGFGVGAYLIVDQFSTKTSFSEPTPIVFNDGSQMVGMRISITDKNIIGKNTNESGTVVFALDKNGKRIADGAGYTVNLQNKEIGLTTTYINKTGKISVTVDPKVFNQAIKKNTGASHRFLSQDQGSDNQLQIQELTESFKGLYGDILEDSFQFEEIEVFQLPIHSKRRLEAFIPSEDEEITQPISRKLLVTLIKSAVQKTVPTITSFNNAVKKNDGPIRVAIDAAVAAKKAETSSATSNAAMAPPKAGDTSLKVENIAKTVVNKCITANNATIKCNPTTSGLEPQGKITKILTSLKLKS